MPDEIERIVDEVLARLGHGETRGVTPPLSARVTAASGVPLQSVLILTEDLRRVSTVLGSASRRQRQAISVFVGGNPRHRSSGAVLASSSLLMTPGMFEPILSLGSIPSCCSAYRSRQLLAWHS